MICTISLPQSGFLNFTNAAFLDLLNSYTRIPPLLRPLSLSSNYWQQRQRTMQPDSGSRPVAEAVEALEDRIGSLGVGHSPGAPVICRPQRRQPRRGVSAALFLKIITRYLDSL